MPTPAPATTAEFTDAWGITVVYDHYVPQQPEGTPLRGVVQLLHGVGEHAGRYRPLIDALTGAGFAVYADDHRGHGRTGILQYHDPARLGKLGPGGLRAARAAVWQLTELIRAENPGVPLILFGHSWGSFLAQMLINEHSEAFAALVLSGSALRTPQTLNAAPLNARWAGPDAHGLEWLSRDPAVWQSFRDDPLTTETPLLKLFGVADALRLYGRPARNLPHDIPVLLQVGRDDPVGGPRSVHLLADSYRSRSGLSDVSVLVYPDARHEIYNEPEADQVRADLLAWLDQHFVTGGDSQS